MLKSSRGALMWHGRDLRHFKRILAPPLQQLLTQVRLWGATAAHALVRAAAWWLLTLLKQLRMQVWQRNCLIGCHPHSVKWLATLRTCS